MSITLHQVTRRFGDHAAVDRLDAEIETGTFFVVLGPSGCGKSTLLRLIAGLETLDGGRIDLDGATVAGPGLHRAPEDRGVGVVFQSYALWPHMDVRRNVAFPLEARGARRADALRDAGRHLDTVALGPFATRRPAELSGGQRQRVALARCLASGARVILMDEPLANLDPHLRHAMEGELAAFHRTSGATTLYITHDQREAMALADRIAVMRDGRFEQVAAPEEIYTRPANAFVAGFVGTGAIVETVAEGPEPEGRTGARLGTTTLACDGTADAGQPARVLIRPEWVRAAAPAPDTLPGTVESVTFRGSHHECAVRVDGVETPLLVHLDMAPRPGETLGLHIRRGWILPDRTV